jgi:dTDP-6-deoxy-L-talose 4-dehydrogenase (NAD+)
VKILVTGATGFIGRHVIDQLLKLEHVSIIVTSSSIEKLNFLYSDKKVSIIEFDYYNINFSQWDLFKYFNFPDKVIHLSWRGLPNYNSSFHMLINLNVEYAFLSNFIQNGLKDLIVTGTCFEYGLLEGELNEGLISNPQNYYSLSKDTLRKMLKILQFKFQFNLLWLRPFYIYGSEQKPQSIFGQLDIANQNGDSYFNMSKGDQLRDYLTVEEVAYYICELSIYSNYDGIVNISSGRPIMLIKLVKNYMKKHGYNFMLNRGVMPYSVNEPFAFWGNNSLMLNLINNSDKRYFEKQK